MNLLKQIILFSLFLPLFTPLLGMEKSVIAWFQPGNAQIPISFEAESLPYSKTLEWLNNEAPTTEQNPSFIREVSQNTLATCKMIFEHLHAIKDQLVDNEQKASYLANYFSTEIAELNEEEVEFLDIPVFAQVLKKNNALFFSKKRKHEGSQTADSAQKKYVTLITTDDQEIQMLEAPLKKAKVFYDVINDIDQEGENTVIPTNLHKESAETLATFLNYIQEQEEEINQHLDTALLEKTARLMRKKDEKLRVFTAPLETTFVIDLDEQSNQKKVKFHAKQQRIQKLPEEQKKQLQQEIENKFAYKMSASKEYFEKQKNKLLDEYAKKYIKKYCSTFQEAIGVAEIGDFAGCTLLFENALDVAHDFLTVSDGTIDFEVLNHSIASRLNEKIQASIIRKKFFDRNQSNSTIENNLHNLNKAHLIRLDDADIALWSRNIVVKSNITNETLLNMPIQISPDRRTLARKNDTNGSIEIIDLKTKKTRDITFNTLFPLDNTEFIPLRPIILSFFYLPDNSGLEIKVDYKEAIHVCRYSFSDCLLTKIKKIDLPTPDAQLLWEFPENNCLFIQKKALGEKTSTLFFNKKSAAIPHGSTNLVYCFTHDHRKIIAYSDTESTLYIFDAKKGYLLKSILILGVASNISCFEDGKSLAVLSQPYYNIAQISIFDIDSGKVTSTFDISDQLSYSSNARTNLNRIVNFYITPSNNNIIVEQSAGLMGRGLIASIIDIKTKARILGLSDYKNITCLPDGSIMQVKTIDEGQLVNVIVSYELFDGKTVKSQLRACSLEESLLIEKIINRNAYVLSASEEEIYKTLPQEIQNKIQSHLA